MPIHCAAHRVPVRIRYVSHWTQRQCDTVGLRLVARNPQGKSRVVPTILASCFPPPVHRSAFGCSVLALAALLRHFHLTRSSACPAWMPTFVASTPHGISLSRCSSSESSRIGAAKTGSRRGAMAQRQQRGWLKKENRVPGETWVFYFRTTRKSDGKRVGNKIPIGLVQDFPDRNSARAEIERLHLQINRVDS